jgi:hypothetical protein
MDDQVAFFQIDASASERTEDREIASQPNRGTQSRRPKNARSRAAA